MKTATIHKETKEKTQESKIAKKMFLFLNFIKRNNYKNLKEIIKSKILCLQLVYLSINC